MKKLVFICLLLLITAPAMAKDICTDLAGLASKIMEVRQAGVPIIDVMKVMEANSTGDAKQDAVVKNIVFAAYETPKFETNSVKNQAIVEFTNKVYLMCETN